LVVSQYNSNRRDLFVSNTFMYRVNRQFAVQEVITNKRKNAFVENTIILCNISNFP